MGARAVNRENCQRNADPLPTYARIFAGGGGETLKDNLRWAPGLLIEKIVEETQTPYLPTQEYSLGSNHRTA